MKSNLNINLGLKKILKVNFGLMIEMPTEHLKKKKIYIVFILNQSDNIF